MGATGGISVSNAIDPRSIDLSEVAREFADRLDALWSDWDGISAQWREAILDQVRSAVTSDDLAALAAISVSTAAAREALTAAMVDMALTAAKQMSREAREQGARVDPVASDGSLFAEVAAAVVALLAQGLTNAAGREALRQWSPTTSGDDVAASVRQHLEELSDAFPRLQLGAALTAAQNTGRLNTALAVPSVALYASEQMDANTCGPCRRVDGKWLGNTDDPGTPARVAEVYPNGGYRFCQGGPRCRGTIVAVYRPEQVTAVLNHPGHSSQKSHGRRGPGDGTPRESLAKAATTVDLEAAARSELRAITGRDIPVSLQGLDVELGRHHMEGVLRGMEAFPGADLRSIETFGPNSSKGDADFHGRDMSSAYAVTSSDRNASGSDMFFNTTLDFDEQASQSRYEDSVGYTSGRKGDMTRIAVHEVGHVVHQSTRGRLATDHAQDVAIHSALDRGRKVEEYVHEQISGYANASNGELFAEAFTDVVTRGSGASQLSRQIVSDVEANFDRWRYP